MLVPTSLFYAVLDIGREHFDNVVNDKVIPNSPSAFYRMANVASRYFTDAEVKEDKRKHAIDVCTVLDNAKSLSIRDYPTVTDVVNYICTEIKHKEQASQDRNIQKKLGSYNSLLKSFYSEILAKLTSYFSLMGYSDGLSQRAMEDSDIFKKSMLMFLVDLNFNKRFNSQSLGAVDNLYRRSMANYDRNSRAIKTAIAKFGILFNVNHDSQDFLELQRMIYPEFMISILKGLISKLNCEENKYLQQGIVEILQSPKREEQLRNLSKIKTQVFYMNFEKSIQSLRINSKHLHERMIDLLIAKKPEQDVMGSFAFRSYKIEEKRSLPLAIYQGVLSVYKNYLDRYAQQKSLLPQTTVLDKMLSTGAYYFADEKKKACKINNAKKLIAAFIPLSSKKFSDLDGNIIELNSLLEEASADLKRELDAKALNLEPAEYESLLDSVGMVSLESKAFLSNLGYNDKIESRNPNFMDYTNLALMKLMTHLKIILSLYNKVSRASVELKKMIDRSDEMSKYRKILNDVELWMFRLSSLNLILPIKNKFYTTTYFNPEKAKNLSDNAIVISNPVNGISEIHFVQGGKILPNAIRTRERFGAFVPNVNIEPGHIESVLNVLSSHLSKRNFNKIKRSIQGAFKVSSIDLVKSIKGVTAILDSSNHIYLKENGRDFTFDKVRFLDGTGSIKFEDKLNLIDKNYFIDLLMNSFPEEAYSILGVKFYRVPTLEHFDRQEFDKNAVILTNDNKIYLIKDGKLVCEPSVVNVPDLIINTENLTLNSSLQKYLTSQGYQEKNCYTIADITKADVKDIQTGYIYSDDKLYFVEKGELSKEPFSVNTEQIYLNTAQGVNEISLNKELIELLVEEKLLPTNKKCYLIKSIQNANLENIEDGLILTKDKKIHIVKNGKVEENQVELKDVKVPGWPKQQQEMKVLDLFEIVAKNSPEKATELFDFSVIQSITLKEELKEYKNAVVLASNNCAYVIQNHEIQMKPKFNEFELGIQFTNTLQESKYLKSHCKELGYQEENVYAVNNLSEENLSKINAPSIVITADKKLHRVQNGKIIEPPKFLQLKSTNLPPVTEQRESAFTSEITQALKEIEFFPDVRCFSVDSIENEECSKIQNGFIVTKEREVYFAKDGQLEQEPMSPLECQTQCEHLNEFFEVELSPQQQQRLQQLVKENGLSTQDNQEFYDVAFPAICEDFLRHLSSYVAESGLPRHCVVDIEYCLTQIVKTPEYVNSNDRVQKLSENIGSRVLDRYVSQMLELKEESKASEGSEHFKYQYKRYRSASVAHSSQGSQALSPRAKSLM